MDEQAASIDVLFRKLAAAVTGAVRRLSAGDSMSDNGRAKMSLGANQSRARFEAFARESGEQADALRRMLAGNGTGSDG